MKTETYVCQSCCTEVERTVARGQRPKWCPDCRAKGVWNLRSFKCTACGERVTKSGTKFCSQLCRVYDRYGPWVTDLPKRHPVVVAQSPHREPKPRERSAFTWRTARECPGCACWFTPLYTPNALACSKRCVRRIHRWRRKAAERGAIGAFTWSQFMRVARRFDYRCAYCGDKPGQLEPDHVVPLSRGGGNTTTNLLPSCRPCNADKNANLLPEWAESRERRGLPPRATNWAPEDRRYWHLTDATLAAA